MDKKREGERGEHMDGAGRGRKGTVREGVRERGGGGRFKEGKLKGECAIIFDWTVHVSMHVRATHTVGSAEHDRAFAGYTSGASRGTNSGHAYEQLEAGKR